MTTNNSCFNQDEANYQEPEQTSDSITTAVINDIERQLQQRSDYYKPSTKELKAAVLGCQAGDIEATLQLYQWFKPLVLALSHSYSVYSVLKEDAENIAWEHFYTFIKDYNDNNYAYLPGLIRLRLISRLMDESSSRKYYDPHVDYLEEKTDDELTTTTILDDHVADVHLKAALQKLKPLQKSIIQLLYFKDYSAHKAAIILKKPYHKIWYHHNRAKNTLRVLYLENKLVSELSK